MLTTAMMIAVMRQISKKTRRILRVTTVEPINTSHRDDAMSPPGNRPHGAAHDARAHTG